MAAAENGVWRRGQVADSPGYGGDGAGAADHLSSAGLYRAGVAALRWAGVAERYPALDSRTAISAFGLESQSPKGLVIFEDNSVDWLLDLFIDRLFGPSIASIDWLIDRAIDRSFDWLMVRLVD